MTNSKENSEYNKLKKGVYLLPNLITTGGLFAGFYAVVAAMKGAFDIASIAIFIAMLADGLDGRIARLTNTQSAFGTQYDSLSDIIGFGVAPALVAYRWSLMSLGKFGWLVAFFFTVSCALRLARFNVQSDETTDKRYFQGLPCPSAAAIIAGMIWTANEYEIAGSSVFLPVAIVTMFVAMLMVSNIPYHSFKEIDLKGKVPSIVALLVVLLYMCISLDPPFVLFLFFSLYALSGVFSFIWKYCRRKKA